MGFNLYMHNQHKDVCLPQNGEWSDNYCDQTIGTLMINHRNLGDPIFRQTLGRGIDRMSRHVSHAFFECSSSESTSPALVHLDFWCCLQLKINEDHMGGSWGDPQVTLGFNTTML